MAGYFEEAMPEEEHAVMMAIAKYLEQFDYLFVRPEHYGLIVRYDDGYILVPDGQVRIHNGSKKIIATIWSNKNSRKDNSHRRDPVHIDLYDPDSFRKIHDQFYFGWTYTVSILAQAC